jgi:hypothetical protein
MLFSSVRIQEIHDFVAEKNTVKGYVQISILYITIQNTSSPSTFNTNNSSYISNILYISSISIGDGYLSLEGAISINNSINNLQSPCLFGIYMVLNPVKLKLPKLIRVKINGYTYLLVAKRDCSSQ